MKQLLMTAQLKLAIELLSKPHAQVVTVLREHAAGLRELRPDEVDPLDARDLEDGWVWQRLPMLPVVAGQPEPDVWLTGEPLVVTANGTLPRFFVDESASREAQWILRAVRQRARAYAKVAAELVAANEAWLRTRAGAPTRVTLRAVAEKIGMHESTISRVCSVGVMQSARGFTHFDELVGD